MILTLEALNLEPSAAAACDLQAGKDSKRRLTRNSRLRFFMPKFRMYSEKIKTHLSLGNGKAF